MMGRGKNGLEDWRIVVVAMWKEKKKSRNLANYGIMGITIG